MGWESTFFESQRFWQFIYSPVIAQALADYGFTLSEINYLRYNPAKLDAYSDILNCKYAPDSRINDLNSPFFKDCQGTPYQVTLAGYRNIMAYSFPICGEFFTTGQGIRVHETIEEYASKFVPVMSQYSIDLYVRDTESDIGQEPNIHAYTFWNSKDIWVRNQNDGALIHEHQNPKYHTINPNFVYVNVRNKGCGTSSGNDQLKLYWAKNNTALNWDEYWTGQVVIDGVAMGGELGTATIPPLGPGEDHILEFEWLVPNPLE